MKRFLYWVLESIPLSRSCPVLVFGIWFGEFDHNLDAQPDLFEKRALQITGTAFYLLAAGLLVTASINIYEGHRPETTFWGIVIASDIYFHDVDFDPLQG